MTIMKIKRYELTCFRLFIFIFGMDAFTYWHAYFDSVFLKN